MLPVIQFKIFIKCVSLFRFELSGLSQIKQVEALLCNMTFRTLIDNGVKNCQLTNNLRDHDKKMKTNTLKLIKGFIANSNANLNAAITSFINYAENNSDKWSEFFVWHQQEFLSSKFPCKLENP